MPLPGRVEPSGAPQLGLSPRCPRACMQGALAGLDWRACWVLCDLYRSTFPVPGGVAEQPLFLQVGWSCSPKEQLGATSGNKEQPGARDLYTDSPVHLTKEIPINIPH